MNNAYDCVYTKLCPLRFGIAVGVTMGLYLMVLAWAGHFGHAVPIVIHLSNMYPGYAPTIGGGIIGAIWGFIDGFIFGALVAFIYDLCCGRKCTKKTETIVVDETIKPL